MTRGVESLQYNRCFGRTPKNRTGRLASAIAFGMDPHGGQVRMVARKSGWIAARAGAVRLRRPMPA
jgi:hypothetical protein